MSMLTLVTSITEYKIYIKYVNTNYSYSLQLIHAKPLHFNCFIITTSVIEWITTFRKIVEYVARIKHWNPITIVP